MAHELNTTDIITRSVERNRYFYGKLMTVRDFLQEQQYFNSKRQLLNRLLFGSGVICGLDVREGVAGMSATQIDVDPGVALDPLGREITVTRRDRFDLRDLKDLKPVGGKTERTILICLAYNECQKEPVPSMKSSPCDEACESNRVTESYTVEWDDPTPAPDNTLCEEWMNRTTVASPAAGQVRIERSAPLWVRQGETFEVVVKVTARQNVASLQLTEIVANGNIIEPVVTTPNPPITPAGLFPTPPVSLQDGEFFVYIYQVEAPKHAATITIRTGGGLPSVESSVGVVTAAEAAQREIDQRLKDCDETPPRLSVPVAEATVRFSGSQVSGIKKLETRGVQRFRYNLERVSELLECVRENIQAEAGSPRPGHALITFKDLENREPQPVRATPGARGVSFTVARGDHSHALLLESQSGLVFGEGSKLRVDGAVGGQAIDFQYPVLGRTPVQSRHLVTKEYVDSKLAGLDWRESVKDKDLHRPPPSPAVGDRYLVLSTAIRVPMPPQPSPLPERLRIRAGDEEDVPPPPPPPKDDDDAASTGGENPWKGFESRITTWNGTEWEFEPIPDEGTAVFVEDENTAYLFVDGKWIPFLAQPSITAGDGLRADGAILSVGQGAGLQVNADDVTLVFAKNTYPVGDRRSVGNDNSVARGDHEHDLPLAPNSGLEFVSPLSGDPDPSPQLIYPPPIIKPPGVINPQDDLPPAARPEEATLLPPEGLQTRDASAQLRFTTDSAKFEVASPDIKPAEPPSFEPPTDEIKTGVISPKPRLDTPIDIRPTFDLTGFPIPIKPPVQPPPLPQTPPILQPPAQTPPIFQPPILHPPILHPPLPPIEPKPTELPPVEPPQPPIIEPPSPLPLPRPSRFKQLRVNGPVGGEQIDFQYPVLGRDPSLPRHLATKQYVDAKIAGLDWQESVKDKDLARPPLSLNIGDRYLILSDEIIIRPPAPDDLPPKPTDEEFIRPLREDVRFDELASRLTGELDAPKQPPEATTDDIFRLPPAGGGGILPLPPSRNPWRGHVNEITTWNGKEWEFVTADEGTAVFVEDENAAYLFVNGKWIPFLASGQTQIKAGAGLRLGEDTLSVVAGEGVQVDENGVRLDFGAAPPPPVSYKSDTGGSSNVARADHTHELNLAPNSGLMFRDIFTRQDETEKVERIVARPTAPELQINGPIGGERIDFLQTVSGQDPVEPQHLVTKRYVDSKIAGLDWQESVLDKDLDVPPEKVERGHRYLILRTQLRYCPPDNPWEGYRDNIATWNGETWDFTAPNEGMTVFVEDENNAYIYVDGKWVQFLSLAAPPPPPPPSERVAETTTGVVVFDFNQGTFFEPVVSNPIDARVGPGPICVRLGLEDKERGILLSPDSFTFRDLGYPPVELAAEVIYGRFRERENTLFRIWVRVSEKTEIPTTNFAVRWWAYPAGNDLGMTFFNEGGPAPIK